MSTHAFDPDPLQDVCPECGERINDDDEWTRVHGVIYHLACVEVKGTNDIRDRA